MSNLPQPLSMLVFVVGVGVIALLGIILMMANLYRQMIRHQHQHQRTERRPLTDFCTYPGCNCPFDAPADAEWCARGYPHHVRGVAKMMGHMEDAQ